MTEHPRMRLIDVYANLLQDFTHQPTLHANYGSKMVSVNDGLPKYRDLPAELGGAPAKPWPIRALTHKSKRCHARQNGYARLPFDLAVGAMRRCRFPRAISVAKASSFGSQKFLNCATHLSTACSPAGSTE